MSIYPTYQPNIMTKEQRVKPFKKTNFMTKEQKIIAFWQMFRDEGWYLEGDREAELIQRWWKTQILRRAWNKYYWYPGGVYSQRLPEEMSRVAAGIENKKCECGVCLDCV